MADSEFTLDLTQTFLHLGKAPIIEAVIEIRTRAESAWEESTVTNQLKASLPDYPTVLSLTAIQQEIILAAEAPPEGKRHEIGWSGLRFESADKHHIVQFHRDKFVFSRLQPYTNWEELEKEARRLWEFHVNVAKPIEIERLGVRFINRIAMLAQYPELEDYLDPHPVAPHGLRLPVANFLHRETLLVPGFNYGINLTRALQVPNQTSEGVAIILDIDVFTTESFPVDDVNFEKRFREMRWLKNKSFFGSITSKALEVLQ